MGRGAVETVDGLGGCGGVRDGKDGSGVVDGSAIEDDASLVLLVDDVLDEGVEIVLEIGIAVVADSGAVSSETGV